ncbi:MAG: hypothetical protein NTW60_02985 [Candidatus Wolfebacteria bacterium]|nr:hypothetical protein [Candidatus Wolfebacteria bacterium]
MTTSKGFCDTIRGMWRFIRKWWILEKLDDLSSEHTQVQDENFVVSGHHIRLTQEFFVMELVKKYKNNLPKKKKKAGEYHSLIKECLEGIDDKEKYIKPSKGIASNNSEVAGIEVSSDGYKIHGIFGLAETLLLKYKFSWSIIIAPLITVFIGYPYINSLLDWFLKLIKVKD